MADLVTNPTLPRGLSRLTPVGLHGKRSSATTSRDGVALVCRCQLPLLLHQHLSQLGQGRKLNAVGDYFDNRGIALSPPPLLGSNPRLPLPTPAPHLPHAYGQGPCQIQLHTGSGPCPHSPRSAACSFPIRRRGRYEDIVCGVMRASPAALCAPACAWRPHRRLGGLHEARLCVPACARHPQWRLGGLHALRLRV